MFKVHFRVSVDFNQALLPKTILFEIFSQFKNRLRRAFHFSRENGMASKKSGRILTEIVKPKEEKQFRRK